MSAATDGRVHVTHPDLGAEALISAEPDVVALYVAKGWVVSDDVPAHLDPDHQGEPVAEPAEDSPAPAPVETTDDTAPADDDEEEVIERG